MTKIFNIFFGVWLIGAHPTPLGCTVQRVRIPLLVEIESDHIIAVVADDPLGGVGCRFVADRDWYIYHKNHSLNRNRPRVQGSGAVVGSIVAWIPRSRSTHSNGGRSSILSMQTKGKPFQIPLIDENRSKYVSKQ